MVQNDQGELRCEETKIVRRTKCLFLSNVYYYRMSIFRNVQVLSGATGDGTEVGHTSLSSASIRSGEIIVPT